MTTFDDPRFPARVRYILERTLAEMPDAERAERVAHCQRTGEHGVRAEREPDGSLRFTWGGSLLAIVEADAFTDDGYLRPLEIAHIRDFPDDPSGLDNGA